MILNWLQQKQNKISPIESQQNLRTLFYDCETINCLPIGEKDLNYRYCQSVDDYLGMGISVIGVYTSWTKRYHVFLKDNLEEFQLLIAKAQRIVGFNSIAFDDNLCNAHGIKIVTNYDLLCEVRKAVGMPPHYVKGVTKKGYSLNELAKANINFHQTSSGAIAPKLWQEGKCGQVIDYCLNDVFVLKCLYDLRKKLIDPINKKSISLLD